MENPALLETQPGTSEFSLLQRGLELEDKGETWAATLTYMKAFLSQERIGGEHALSDNTKASYGKELLRFLLFMKHKGLGTVTGISQLDAKEYLDWLRKPPSNLISATGARHPRDHPEWKPFSQQPSNAAINYSFRVLKSFFTWLRKCDVINRNSFSHLRESRQHSNSPNPAKALTNDDLALIFSYLERPILSTENKTALKNARFRWILLSYLYLGLRASELISCSTADLHETQVRDEKIWQLQLIGKGSKASTLPVPQQFIEELKRYRYSLGKPGLPVSNSPEPLLFSITGSKAIRSRQQVFSEFKKLMAEVITANPDMESSQRARMANASPHTLRHTFVTGLLDSTNDYPAVQEAARHSDFKTTMSYDTTHMLHMAKVIEGFAEKTGKLLGG